jgi:hypothetical protein
MADESQPAINCGAYATTSDVVPAKERAMKLRHSGARASANPESRADNLQIPGSALRAAPE